MRPVLSPIPLTCAKREGGAKRKVVNSEPIKSPFCAELGYTPLETWHKILGGTGAQHSTVPILGKEP